MREGLRVAAGVLGGALLLDGAVAAIVWVGLLVRDLLVGASAITWVLGRAAGLTSYVLLLVLVGTGLVMTHPWARRHGVRISLPVHRALATFTLAFTVLHVVVLALDPWAQLGWAGVLVPMASSYRPVPVTLGVIALWAGLLTGLTARFAGRLPGWLWWGVHRGAVGLVVAVWAHAVLAGSDTGALRGFYLATGALLAGLAITRYAAATPQDRTVALTRALHATTPLPEAEVARPVVRAGASTTCTTGDSR